jgi:HSP20 family protein
MMVRYNDFNRLFDWPHFDRRPVATNGENGVAVRRPATNVYDGEDGYVLELEVPGISPDDIEVSLDGDTLTLSGTRELEAPEGHEATTREWSSYRFSRSFRLPKNLDLEKIDAELVNGVLRLTLPRGEAHKPRQIGVRAA